MLCLLKQPSTIFGYKEKPTKGWGGGSHRRCRHTLDSWTQTNHPSSMLALGSLLRDWNGIPVHTKTEPGYSAKLFQVYDSERRQCDLLGWRLTEQFQQVGGDPPGSGLLQPQKQLQERRRLQCLSALVSADRVGRQLQLFIFLHSLWLHCYCHDTDSRTVPTT